MRLLIVDDEEVARASLAWVLAGMGAQVVHAEDGDEAWALLEGGLRVDLCCSDVMMPRMGGLELLRRLRAHPLLRDLPFVLVSVAADRATLDLAVASGADGYILKPFLAAQARCIVERVLCEHRAARREHFLVTRRRLGLSLEALEAQLRALGEAAQACASGGCSAPELGPLHLEAQRLGLWKAADLLERALRADTLPDHGALFVAEVPHLVADQLQAMRQLEPAPLEGGGGMAPALASGWAAA